MRKPNMNLRILIAAENSSLKFGGEAALPLHYFRVLRARGIEAWLVTHVRTRAELIGFFPDDQDRMFFIPDTVLHRMLWRAGGILPDAIAVITTGYLLRIWTQILQRRIIRRLVQEMAVSVIHQPVPVSPKEPSLLFGLGAPVVIGPMNGGMDYPPAFRRMQSRWVESSLGLGRRLSHVLNFLIPGKRRAAMLLVANERTRLALPRGVCTEVVELVENGVDLSLWRPPTGGTKPDFPFTRYVFAGRLVDWKAVDLLLLAFKDAATKAQISLTIIGDGIERPGLEALASEIGVRGSTAEAAGKVIFAGWLSQKECAEWLSNADAMVLPSLMECGGAVVLEAMAMGIPVIASDWGGPADYLDPSTGILVKPESRDRFIEGLSAAMVRLARFPDERLAMGSAARRKVVREFDWEVKVDRMLKLYQQVVDTETSTHPRNQKPE